jgi:SAM-dependent methyltransferase
MKNGSCASIVLITVLCYLDDPRQAFAELSRVLVSDGTLLIGFLEKDGAVARRTRTQPGKSRFLSRARFYASGEIASFLARAGLSIRRQDSRAGFCIILAQKRKGFSGLLHDPVADPDSRSPEPTR